MHRHVLAGVAALTIAAAPTQVRARDDDSAGTPPAELPTPHRMVTTMRVTPPLGLWIGGINALTTLGGASLTVRAWNLFESEFAFHYALRPCAQGPVFTTRIGVSPGQTVRAPLLLGYSYGLLNGGGCDNVNPDERAHMATLAAGVEGNSGRFALRLLPFIGIAWRHVFADQESGSFTTGAIFGAVLEFGWIVGGS